MAPHMLIFQSSQQPSGVGAVITPILQRKKPGHGEAGELARAWLGLRGVPRLSAPPRASCLVSQVSVCKRKLGSHPDLGGLCLINLNNLVFRVPSEQTEREGC